MINETDLGSTDADPATSHGSGPDASHRGTVPTDRSQPHSAAFFSSFADDLIRAMQPRRVFDLGCAHGFLVEALRDRGVEAWGRSNSEFAIAQVRADIREYCSVGDLAAPIEGRFDLVVSIDVLEHLTQAAAVEAIANMTSAADRVVFSSSRSDPTGPRHLDIEPMMMSWLRQFAERDFTPLIEPVLPTATSLTLLFERRETRPSDEYLAACHAVVGGRFEVATQTAKLTEVIRMRDWALDDQSKINQRLSLQLRQTHTQLEATRSAHHKIEDKLVAATAAEARIRVELATVQRALHGFMVSYNAIERSTTWRITRPFRALFAHVPTLRFHLRRGAKGSYWIITPWRSKERLRFLRQRRLEKGVERDQAVAGERATSVPRSGLEDRSGSAVSALPIVATHAPSLPPPPMPRRVLPDLEADPSLAVPSDLASAARAHSFRIAVICHLYHVSLTVEVMYHLTNIPYPCDVYISTDDDEKKRRIETVFASYSQGKVEVRVVPNRGRDIAPKLVAFADVYARYAFCLHIHSKQSTHDVALQNWRHYLFATLLGSPDIVRTIFGAFAASADLGIVAAQHYPPVRRWINWGGNFARAAELVGRMGLSVDEEAALDFPSGSMFWARCDALKPLLALSLTNDDFDPEFGQYDGTLAHAIERIYFVSSEAAGLRWIKVGRPEFFGSDTPFSHAATATDLDRFLRSTCWRIGDCHRQPGTEPIAAIDSTPRELVADVQRRALGTYVPRVEPKIAVGVVTYDNSDDQLERCLRSAGAADRLLVWDNGKRTAPRPDVIRGRLTHRAGEGNLGFGAAHNRLMRLAFEGDADAYFCLNPDGFLHPSAIERIGRMITLRQGTALVECTQFPVDHPKSVDPMSFRTAWGSGAALAIPRRVYDVIGGFDEGFFMYCEDVDYSWRARAQGFETVICPNAYFVHEVTNRTLSEGYLRMVAESGARLGRKWGSDEFERWALLQRPGARPPGNDVSVMPIPWRDVPDFEHGFSFSKTRWS